MGRRPLQRLGASEGRAGSLEVPLASRVIPGLKGEARHQGVGPLVGSVPCWMDVHLRLRSRRADARRAGVYAGFLSLDFARPSSFCFRQIGQPKEQI